MRGRYIVGLLHGALLSSAWWALAMFGFTPYILVPTLFFTIFTVAVWGGLIGMWEKGE